MTDPRLQVAAELLQANVRDCELIFRTSRIEENGRIYSYNSFLWPQTPGEVVRPTHWDSQPLCGEGIHGITQTAYLYGLFHNSRRVLQILLARKDELVDLGDKVKCRRAVVLSQYVDEPEWFIADALAFGARPAWLRTRMRFAFFDLWLAQR